MSDDRFVYADTRNFRQLNFLRDYMVGHNGFIAGGCFKNILQGERVKDLDIFFETKDDWNAAINHFKNSEIFVFHYENEKVKAYKHKESGIVVELINKIYGNPENVLSSFDFTICKFAYYKLENEFDSYDYEIVYHKDFFEHLYLKRLVADDKITYPTSTFQRMIKYIKYGFMPCRETKAKIIDAIKSTKLQDDISNSLYDGLD